MTTDRTQPARPAAPNDRSSAPAERRDGSAFAALLDAHVPAPAAAPRREESQPRDAAAAGRQDQPRDAAAGHDPAAAQQGGSSETPAQPAPDVPVLAPAGQPAVLPPFVATVPAEAPATPATPLPAAPLPIFMLAPEAVAAAVPVAPVLPVAPEVPAGVAAAVLPETGLPAAPTPVVTPQPAAPAQAAVAPAGEEPAPAAPQAQAEAPAQEAELPVEVAEAPVAPVAPEPHAAPARTVKLPEPVPAAAPAAQAPAAEPLTAAPATTPLSGTAAPERTVPMHRAPAAVATLLHVAAERGITHAKMALRPVELGGIEIRLQASAAGIAAQVIADSPEAAKLLAQAGDDLRRALEARDVTLISLEVSTSSEQRGQSARGEWSDSRDNDPTSPRRAADDADGDTEPAPTTQTVIELPGGLLVDVLA